MSSLEAKIKGTKDKKPTAEKLERLRREKVGPQHSNIPLIICFLWVFHLKLVLTFGSFPWEEGD